MTNWLPDISSGSGPLYQRLADTIERDIDSGTLAPGAKLPPQRNLAFDIGVTVGTVGRAYALLRQRGLVTGETGRGTYIRQHVGVADRALEPHQAFSTDNPGQFDPPTGKLRFDSTAAPDIGQSSSIGTIMADIVKECPHEITSYTRRFPDGWFQAGSKWLARCGFTPDPACTLPTLGAHAASMAVISAVSSPGDYIVFEHLTYSQVTRSAELIGRRAALVGSDEDGVIPDDFERLCAQLHPKIMFVMPTVQNPTGSTMPEYRRREIAAIARKYSVWLIEDDIYGALSDDMTPLLISFAPERTFLIGGLSKSVSAGVRGGWVACPPHLTQRVRTAHKMVTGGTPFLLKELSARIVLNGLATEIRQRCIAENCARLDIARQILAGHQFVSRENIPFIWLSLPEPWLSGTFKKAAYQEGVMVDDEDEFRAGRTNHTYHRIRIGISAEHEREAVARGIHIIRQLLDSGRAGYDSFI
jgi:DNA-binding transcriptional MocR family regulator